MTLILQIALFLMGIVLSVQVIASLYGIIDLWYTMKSAYPKVLRGILGWGGISFLMAVLLNNPYRPAFLWGLFSFVLFHIGNYWGTKLLIRLSASKGFE